MISPAHRWSSLFTLGLVTVLLVFFALHQSKHTGFFTDRFGPAEMIALYLPIVISLIAPLLRIIQGTNKIARPIELISDVCLALGSIWLWITFPFDFSHFANLFPIEVRYTFGWLTDTAGRVLLVVQAAGGSLSALTTTIGYLRERRK